MSYHFAHLPGDLAAHQAEFRQQLTALLTDESDWLANLANTASLLSLQLDRINWVGFYLVRGHDLVLGPFIGKPACTRIAWGRGVCGTAAARGETLVVPNVHQFPGHIACDAASSSEIVVPLWAGGQVVGVLDVDSPHMDRFGDDERRYLEEVAGLIAPYAARGRGRS